MPDIDLRSDTVTRPTPEMREAMAAAPVGDDVLGEDPTINLLQERAAALLGKEAALFVPSGTAANQIALLVHCRPGDEVLVGGGTHQMSFESGGGGALAGVQFSVVSERWPFTAGEVTAAIKPDDPHFAPTRLLTIEDTDNGRVWPIEILRDIGQAARARGLALHLDGARLLNAQVASGIPACDRAAPFHTVSLCFSKGLGAPVGSVIAGDQAAIKSARRYRKMLGGGMRQAGVLAAAALYALDHHVDRLAEDHANARLFARRVGSARHARVVEPQTNVVFVEVAETGPTAEAIAASARARGVLIGAMGPRTIRAVTHLDTNESACLRAATILAELLD